MPKQVPVIFTRMAVKKIRLHDNGGPDLYSREIAVRPIYFNDLPDSWFFPDEFIVCIIIPSSAFLAAHNAASQVVDLAPNEHKFFLGPRINQVQWRGLFSHCSHLFISQFDHARLLSDILTRELAHIKVEGFTPAR